MTATSPSATPGQTLDPLRLPLHGSQLIEASAGTGKTFTLALLYLRVVLGHGARGTAREPALMPPNILVVTFTDAATQELRERIRARLVEAADRFAQPAGESAGASEDPLSRLRDDYPEADWPGCARRLRQAAEWMDEAMIATIHGWCQRMLQEHAFATRGPFARELVTDQTDLLLEILRDYWRTHFYALDPADARAIHEVVASPEALHDQLAGWLKQRDAVLSYQGQPLAGGNLARILNTQRRRSRRQRAIAAREERARACWKAHRLALETHLRELRPHLNGTRHGSAKADAFETLLAEIAAWSEGAAAPGKLKTFAQGAFQFKKNAPVQTEEPHPAFAAIAKWQRAEARSQQGADAKRPSLAASLLAHATAWVARELPRRLRLRAEMGFDELLRDLDAALHPPGEDPDARARAAALAATIRDQFPVALIDEFQDTDPIQYRIFDAIYRVERHAPETALLMIGDPKQAIYGFRGADIHAYLAARQATAGRHATLATNYRSTTALVAACNHLFGQAETRPRGAFRFHTNPQAGNPIPYVAVTAQDRDAPFVIDGQAAPAMTFWRLAEDADEAIGAEDYRTRMAESAASAIQRWLTLARAGRAGFQEAEGGIRPLRPKDIAILVRTGTEAAAMRAALAARRIHSVYLSDRDSVFQTQEAADLTHWLRACAAPTDERLVRAALGTNTLAMPLTELARLQQDELNWEREIERFGEYRRIWQRQGVLAMLHRLMHDQELPARLLTRTDGERILTNLLHLVEWLQTAASVLDGEQALIRHLSEHLDRGGDEFIVRLESDAELIQVITIHKSKGLEYPLVLLPFICGWREIDGKTRQVNARPPATAETPDAVGAPARYLEIAGKARDPDAWRAADDARLSEDMRLLYVAITRARQGVWLGIAPLKQGNARQPQLHKSAIGHLLNGGAPFDSPQAVWEALTALRGDCDHIALEAVPAITREVLAAETQAELDPARVPTHAPAPRWWIASYSALRLGASEPAARTEAADTAAQETALEDVDREAGGGRLVERPGGIQNAPAPRLHDLPRGSRYGTFLHGLLEWAAAQQVRGSDGIRLRGYAAAVAAAPARREMLARRCHLRGLGAWVETLDAWLVDVLTRTWTLAGLADAAGQTPTFRLRDLAPSRIQVELEFWLESHAVETQAIDPLVRAYCLPGESRPKLLPNRLNGLLKGFIDLAFEHAGRYYILDWKSNWLGPDDAAYTPEAMRAAVLEHRYDLQYLLYLLALHRQLRARLPGYDYDRHLGGAIYVFLRGSGAPSQGLFTDRPPRGLIEALDRLFAGHSLSHPGATA